MRVRNPPSQIIRPPSRPVGQAIAGQVQPPGADEGDDGQDVGEGAYGGGHKGDGGGGEPPFPVWTGKGSETKEVERKGK